jgi:hypothetical protein
MKMPVAIKSKRGIEVEAPYDVASVNGSWVKLGPRTGRMSPAMPADVVPGRLGQSVRRQ